MAETWNNDYKYLNKLTFSVVPSEIKSACNALDIEDVDSETLSLYFCEEFLDLVSETNNSNIRLELNHALAAVQLVGAAIYLRKQGVNYMFSVHNLSG